MHGPQGHATHPCARGRFLFLMAIDSLLLVAYLIWSSLPLRNAFFSVVPRKPRGFYQDCAQQTSVRNFPRATDWSASPSMSLPFLLETERPSFPFCVWAFPVALQLPGWQLKTSNQCIRLNPRPQHLLANQRLAASRSSGTNQRWRNQKPQSNLRSPNQGILHPPLRESQNNPCRKDVYRASSPKGNCLSKPQRNN